MRRAALDLSTALVGAAAALSRILGFVRDLLIAAALGASPAADALLAALRIPNLLRRILSEGALNGAVVPGLARADAAARPGLERALLWSSAALGALLAIAGALLAGPLLPLVAPGFADDPARGPLAVTLLRLAMPLVALTVTAAMAGALLVAHGRVGAAAAAPVAVNAVLVVALWVLPAMIAAPDRLAMAIAIALAVAGLVQYVVAWAVLRSGRRPSPGTSNDPPSASAWPILARAAPALMVAASAQLAALAALPLASRHDGAVAHFHFADRIYQLPLGFVAAGAGMVLLQALVAMEPVARGRLFARALGDTLALSLPAAVALVLLAPVIVPVLFQRGAFTPADSAGTAAMLAALAPGLPASALARVLAQPFLAGGQMRAPLAAAVLAVGVTVLAGLALDAWAGPAAVAWGVTLGAWAEAAALAVVLWLSGRWQPRREFARRIAGIALATAGMGAGLAWSGPLLGDTQGVIGLGVLCGGGLLLYGLLAWAAGGLRRPA